MGLIPLKRDHKKFLKHIMKIIYLKIRRKGR